MHKLYHFLLNLCGLPQHSRVKVKTASRKKTKISDLSFGLGIQQKVSIKRNNSNLASETLRGVSFNFTEFYKAHKYIEPN
jgi:hypothetical protein